MLQVTDRGSAASGAALLTTRSTPRISIWSASKRAAARRTRLPCIPGLLLDEHLGAKGRWSRNARNPRKRKSLAPRARFPIVADWAVSERRLLFAESSTGRARALPSKRQQAPGRCEKRSSGLLRDRTSDLLGELVAGLGCVGSPLAADPRLGGQVSGGWLSGAVGRVINSVKASHGPTSAACFRRASRSSSTVS